MAPCAAVGVAVQRGVGEAGAGALEQFAQVGREGAVAGMDGGLAAPKRPIGPRRPGQDAAGHVERHVTGIEGLAVERLAGLAGLDACRPPSISTKSSTYSWLSVVLQSGAGWSRPDFSPATEG